MVDSSIKTASLSWRWNNVVNHSFSHFVCSVVNNVGCCIVWCGTVQCTFSCSLLRRISPYTLFYYDIWGKYTLSKNAIGWYTAYTHPRIPPIHPWMLAAVVSASLTSQTEPASGSQPSVPASALVVVQLLADPASSRILSGGFCPGGILSGGDFVWLPSKICLL